MTNYDIKEALAALQFASAELEGMYIENEGEVTEDTELQEERVNALKSLLNTEGVDSLGRWLKAKEDEGKALKAEKDYISRRMEANKNTIEYIKGRIYDVMHATGEEKIKGQFGYSFAQSKSTTTEVDKEVLAAHYGKALDSFKATLPPYITLTLGASISLVKDGVAEGDEGLFRTLVKNTTKFTKPRANKE